MANQILKQITNNQNGLSTLPQSLNLILKGQLDESKLTPSIAFNSGSMASMVKNHSGSIQTAIELLLMKLAMSVNIGKNITPNQSVDIARGIYKKYYKFSIEEVALVLAKGRAGEFGKLYDRLDEMIIMEWFEKYDCSGDRESLVQNARIAEMREGIKDAQEIMHKILTNPIIKPLVDQIKFSAEEEQTKEEKYQEFRKQYLQSKTINSNIEK